MFLYIIIKKGIQMKNTILTLSIISSILSFNVLAKTSYFMQIPLDRVSIIDSDELKPSEEWKTFLNNNVGAFFADSSPLTDLSQLSSKTLEYKFWENSNVLIPEELYNKPLGVKVLSDFNLSLFSTLSSLNFLEGVETVNKLLIHQGAAPDDTININVSGLKSLKSANTLILSNFGMSDFSSISNLTVNDYFEISNSNPIILNKITFGSNIDLNIEFDLYTKQMIENINIKDGTGKVTLRLNNDVISNFKSDKLSSTSKICQKVSKNQLNLFGDYGNSIDPKLICNL